VIQVFLLSSVLLAASWLYGATETWALRIVQGLTALALIGTLAAERGERRRCGARLPSVWQWQWGLPLLLLCGFILAQALNPSHVYTPGNEGLTPIAHRSWLPGSVSARASLEAIGRLLTWAACMAAAARVCRSRPAAYGLLALLLTGGCAMAMLVIVQRSQSPRPPYAMTGMFVNGSNYAAHANMLLPLALSLGRATQLEAATRLRRSHPGFLLYGVAAALAVAVLVSGSRAGAAVAIAIAGAWLVMEWWSARRRGGTLTSGAWIPVVLAVAVFGLLRMDRLAVADLPFADGVWGSEARASVLRSTGRMFGDRWLTGTGAGTFACAFPYYQSRDVAGLYFRYAHNDWVEYPAELGLAGGALLAWLGVAALWPGLAGRGARSRGGPRHRSIWRAYLWRGSLLALAGVGAHALLDFPFHIPGTAVLASALAGVFAASGRQERNSDRAPFGDGDAARTGRG
jgi:O-antigen ligase